MKENKLMKYRGFPLIRSGNEIYYGSGGDSFAARLVIKETKKVADRDIPDKIMVQLLPQTAEADITKARRGEFIGFYEALDTAYVWLTEAIFS